MAEFGYPLNGTEYTAEQAGAYFACRTSGVFPGENNLKVTVSDAENRKLTLSPGVAWFNTESTWGKVYCNTADIIFSLPAADAALKRIVRIIVRWDRNANAFSAQMLTGTAASSPSAPSISRTDEVYDLVLADYLINAGESEASAARLTDQRANEAVCGYTSDGVVRIPTETMYAQFQAWLDLLEEAYDAEISGLLVPHAITHRAGGSDEIDPPSIGAASLDANNKVEAGQTSSRIVSVTASKTLALTDAGTLQQVNSTSNLTITIPANDSVAFPTGTEIELVRWNTGTVTIAAASGVTLVSANSKVKIATRYSCACLKKIATNTWLLVGDLGS